jgi:N-acetylmuramoyl-L-alanine amidase
MVACKQSKVEYSSILPFLAAEVPTRIVIAIDAGHGGPDPGAVNDSLNIYEKNITRQIVDLFLQEADTINYKIIQTRIDDENIHRHTRIARATAANVQLLLTIHVNSLNDSVTNGFEIAYSDSAFYKANETNTDTLSQIHPYKAESRALAEIINANFTKYCKTKNRGVRQYNKNLWMIYGGEFPAVMVEVGYINNRKDIALFNNETGQRKIVKALWESLHHYYGTQPKLVE